MFRALLKWFVVASATVFTALQLDAAVVRRIDFDESCRLATSVVRVRIDAQEASFPRHGIARTYVDATVLDMLKGDAVEKIRFAVPGAKTTKRWVHVAGAPRFEVGDEVVLFLENTRPGMWVCLGLSAGVYRVDRSGVQPRVLGFHAREGETVAAFGDRVRASVAAKGGAK